MKGFVITCVTTILCTLCVTCILELNKTDEVITAIETKEEIAPVYNNYETNNYNTTEVTEVKEVVKEVIVEKEVEVPVPVSNNTSSYSAPSLSFEGGNNFNRTTIKCEVCEKSGTELEVWYDSNNVKHYTCKEKCTNGLDVLYGR